MRCLLIQKNGEHNGHDGWTANDYLRECFAFKYAFEQCGHIADVWGKGHCNFEETPEFKLYDIVLFMEQYDMDWLPDAGQIKGPLKIQWIVDLHCQDKSVYLPLSKNVDVILHSTRSLIDDYEKHLSNKKHLWFPSGVDSRYFDKEKYSFSKTNDISFVGSKNPSRANFIEKLEKSVGLKYQFATGVDMIKAISETKIHFNKNISCDLNYRHFETIGLGTCLITEYQSDLERLQFKDGKNCLWYSTFEECERKIRDNINSGKWKCLGEESYNFSKDNSYIIRIKSMLEKI